MKSTNTTPEGGWGMGEKEKKNPEESTEGVKLDT